MPPHPAWGLSDAGSGAEREFVQNVGERGGREVKWEPKAGP